MSGDAAPLFCSFVFFCLQVFLINGKSIINKLTVATAALSAPHACMLIQLPTNSNRCTELREQARSPSGLSCEVPPPSALCSRSPLLPPCKRVGQGGGRGAFENYPLPSSLIPSTLTPSSPPFFFFLKGGIASWKKKRFFGGPRRQKTLHVHARVKPSEVTRAVCKILNIRPQVQKVTVSWNC